MRGVSAGQIVRDQPGVKEQVGVYLDESVDLALALHAGPRSLRHESRRSAARSAGHAVRLRLAVGNRSLHHQPARARRHERDSPSSASAGSAAAAPAGDVKLGFNVPLGDKAALRVAVVLRPHAGYIDAVQPDLVGQGGRQRRLPHRRARGRSGSRRTTSSPSRRGSSISASRPTAGTASTSSTSSPIRTRPRGRR